MSKLRERIVATLIDRRNKVLNGGINCIPSPFTRFRQDLPGIEQGKLYLISGGTKAAKSQITLYLFVLNTLLYCYNNPNKVKIKNKMLSTLCKCYDSGNVYMLDKELDKIISKHKNKNASKK